jgi:predicted ATP-binding protein involved in virulence
VVEANLKQLNNLEPAIAAAEERHQLVERVNGLGERFGNIMNSASDGISSAKQAAELQKSLGALRNDLAKARREIKNKEALEVLGQLADAIDRNLDQLNEAASSIAEVEKFKALFNKFELTMETLNSGKVHDRQGIQALVRVLADLRVESGELQRNAKTNSIRLQAGELDSALSKILGQIGL